MATNLQALALPAIVVTARTVYGQDLIYPVNEAAKVLAQLVGKKTLSPRDLELARDLGLTVQATGYISAALERFKETV